MFRRYNAACICYFLFIYVNISLVNNFVKLICIFKTTSNRLKESTFLWSHKYTNIL